MPRYKLHQLVILLLCLLGAHFSARAAANDAPITFPVSSLAIMRGQQTLSYEVELATTPEQLSHGLMHRSELASGNGMLFIFPEVRPVTMWMKNTLIPLDMLFIDARGNIQFIAHNTTPYSEAMIPSRVPVKAVLELPGGECKMRGINVGDVVKHAVFNPDPA